ncbi:arf-GAP domain and FG repeat-containing protein 1-like isoform X1 [Vespa mandarinia]|uniref:arf-GAP domain and FG repeat-containing protein 1-like isoform X1 n=2 Tax=Vespa mandarinia TaxID=7446 RepID=UPI001612FC63|nr:arf-GAP domain and FG repeat-containing protein 1-like isoform X1 [Vespa mandarinia]XP_035725208.1 arf-GAP domain and FG repeat-containing protein 1-like isoform X1 [Vespa mandarinia]XP_035725209.1 arf-GAP domain and FG repeat-containing protein 1-like isoform X1 [Vespa mandarinia]
MASAKKKQDEKNLKILRELVSLPGNKECFDCHQRGPTYVNMTIGSFVCTSCSGMLRGLTPPHRVKSITMATFTQEEIDFIKERGNECCARIWLGLMNSNSPLYSDIKDEQKMKDLMNAKYELKRYYLDPSVANQNSTQQSQSMKQTSIPRVPLSGTSTTLPVVAQKIKNSEPASTNNFTSDFVADFSNVPEPFHTTVPVNRLNQSVTPQPFFANFDNNPVFNTPKNTDMSTTLNMSGGNLLTANMNGTKVPPSEDRYAALKDLDFLMKQTQQKEETTKILTSTWNANNFNTTNSIWNADNQTTHVISNPFTSTDVWRPSVNVINNNMQPENSLCNPINPFKQVQFPVNNDSQWMGIDSANNRDTVQFSQLTPPLTNRVWQPTVPAYHANPFMVGTGISTMTRNSKNPFL